MGGGIAAAVAHRIERAVGRGAADQVDRGVDAGGVMREHLSRERIAPDSIIRAESTQLLHPLRGDRAEHLDAGPRRQRNDVASHGTERPGDQKRLRTVGERFVDEL